LSSFQKEKLRQQYNLLLQCFAASLQFAEAMLQCSFLPHTTLPFSKNSEATGR
jgi:hypothetical protein